MVSNDDLRKMRTDLQKGNVANKTTQREATIISAADIARMKKIAVVTSEAEQQQ